jgi:hypothetical protein
VASFNIPVKANTIPLHIIAITYNNEKLIAQQQRLIKKNVADNHLFIVADNSTDPIKRRKIAEACSLSGTGYIPLPPNPYQSGSNSHALSLNWLCKNYLPVVSPRYFGFIDHDIYPVKSHSLIHHLEKQLVYGPFQGGKEYWYLWAGLCFFDASLLEKYELDFTPANINGKYADTGGSNWYKLYRHLDRQKINFPDQTYIALREGNITQSDKMELIGDWLHSFNGSYWMSVPPKENLLFEYLNKL